MRTLLRIACASLLATLLLVPVAQAIVMYASSDVDDFYALDTSDYSLTLLGHHNASPFMGGMAFDAGGTLYGISAGFSPNLYIIDSSNGSILLVGPLNIGFVFEGGLAFDPISGVLYAVNQGNSSDDHLMTIDTSTGQATLVGQIAPGTGKHDFAGLVFDPLGQLYGIDRPTNALWRIDKVLPAGPGSVQIGTGLGSGIVMGNSGGMTSDIKTNTYYGYGVGSRHFFTVNLVTGLATVLHQYGANDPLLYALAYPGELPSAGRIASWGGLKARYR